MQTVRPAVLAGTWYPADPKALRTRVDSFLATYEADKAPSGRPVIALAPHAGYSYSGPVAGAVFGHLRDLHYDAVFILAPSHRTPLERPAVSSLSAFQTPLGDVPLATEIASQLAATGHFEVNDRAHAFEHAVEIQLPLVQRALPPGTPIVPILVSHMDSSRRRRAARALDPWRNDRHLMLVSSDLTHYGREYGYVPFTEDVPQQIEQLDTGALLRFLAHDADGLLAYGQESGITMCGLDAAALALDAPDRGDHESVLLAYTRSADADQDFTMSVSYAAALITVPESAGTGFDDDERRFLLALARQAVTAAAAGTQLPDPADVAASFGLDLGARFAEPCGAFVTLTSDGRLRGCIGYIEGIKPLVEAIVDNAVSAATGDPRFPAVTPEDVPGLHVEVSALTPLRPVDGPQDIEIGRHGILLSRGHNRAVFLPQVAPSQGWDLETTLSQLALKAGLASDAWRTGCSFQVFEAEILEE